MVRFNEYTYITGPFFLACDHGCYHGNGTHGLGVNKCQCGDYEPRFTEKEVIDICTEQICKSDIMIAFINDNTCYGTLIEIGLAKAAGIRIVTIFDTKERKREMWFASSISEYSVCLNDKCSISIFDNFEPHEADSIEDIRERIQKWYKR